MNPTRIRDKNLEGDLKPTTKNRRRYDRKNKDRHYEGYVRLTGEAAVNHENTIRFHEQRIADEENLLRKNGFDPLKAGSAYEFDRLVAKMKVSI